MYAIVKNINMCVDVYPDPTNENHFYEIDDYGKIISDYDKSQLYFMDDIYHDDPGPLGISIQTTTKLHVSRNEDGRLILHTQNCELDISECFPELNLDIFDELKHEDGKIEVTLSISK